jgi:hypothetical protein
MNLRTCRTLAGIQGQRRWTPATVLATKLDAVDIFQLGYANLFFFYRFVELELTCMGIILREMVRLPKNICSALQRGASSWRAWDVQLPHTQRARFCYCHDEAFLSGIMSDMFV